MNIAEHESLWTQQHRDLLENERWTDCAFRVGRDGEEKQLVQCHKLLLSAASPVFAAMLYGDLAEEDGIEISIPDISAEAFRLLVYFVYTDTLTISNMEQHALELTYAAEKYMLPRLIDRCATILEQGLSPENVCHVLEVVRLLNLQHHNEIEHKCWKIIRERTKEVIKFSSFEYIQHSTLLEILQQDKLMLYSESHLIQAVFKWAEREVQRHKLPVTSENLRSALGPALFHLRFLTLSASEFANGPALSDVLTPVEKVCLLVNLTSRAPKMPLPKEFESAGKNRPRPSIAVPCFKFSQEVHSIADSCSEKIMKQMHCHVSFFVNYPVYLIGVEVPSQERPQLYCGATYAEHVTATLQDAESYVLLAVANFLDRPKYNATIEVLFEAPVLLRSFTRYKITAIFNCEGFYRRDKEKRESKTNLVTQ